MSAWLEIMHPGAMASIQDLGRPGFRRFGVPRAGALEAGWLRVANALLRNDEAAPAIEFLAGGLTVRAPELPIRVALAGPFVAERIGPGGRARITSWRSVTLAAGETLRCGMVSPGRVGYLAVAGIDLPGQLGSVSTDVRSGFGGVGGRLLSAGVRLPASAGVGGERTLRRLPPLDTAPIRVVLGPQEDYFNPSALACLLGGDYRISSAADRMGMRLDGPLLQHRPDKGVEIVSDATVPGSIQVPGQGQPIVLLADAQTAGGYPKIATVISADLPRLAVLAPGQSVRFVAVSVASAERAARARELSVRAQIADIGPLADAGDLDLQAIYAANLVSGVIDAGAVEAVEEADMPVWNHREEKG